MSKKPPLILRRPAVAQPSPPSATSKIGPVSMDRNVAQTPEPATTTGAGEIRTFIDTYFTRVPAPGEPTDVVYSADRIWAQVTLTLETAGPVAVGQLSNIAPALSGKGQLLETDVPTKFFVAKGNKLYITSSSINRVKRVVEPVPWLETITGLLSSLAGLSAVRRI